MLGNCLSHRQKRQKRSKDTFYMDLEIKFNLNCILNLQKTFYVQTGTPTGNTGNPTGP